LLPAGTTSCRRGSRTHRINSAFPRRTPEAQAKGLLSPSLVLQAYVPSHKSQLPDGCRSPDRKGRAGALAGATSPGPPPRLWPRRFLLTPSPRGERVGVRGSRVRRRRTVSSSWHRPGVHSALRRRRPGIGQVADDSAEELPHEHDAKAQIVVAVRGRVPVGVGTPAGARRIVEAATAVHAERPGAVRSVPFLQAPSRRPSSSMRSAAYLI
jgi:hypothetical protein